MIGAKALSSGVVLFVLASAFVGQAQDRLVIPLIPASDWRLIKSGTVQGTSIAGFELDPAVERECGVQKRELRHYQLGSRRAEVLLEEASDPTAAYGLFTFYRNETLQPQKGLQFAFIGLSGATMVRGPTCIRVRAVEGSEILRHEFAGLLIAIGGTRPTRAELEDYPPSLPAEGLIPHSEKYLLGLETARRVLPNFRTDLIGFTQGAEARVATYVTRAGDSTILAVNYPTPQIARIRFGAMESMLGINTGEDPGAIFGKRSGSFVFLVLNSSRSEAEKLLSQFQVTSEVSWNEPAPEAERFVLDLARMILSIILLAMLIAVIAVVTGILLAMSRRVAKKFFPDSGWANPEREKLIRLNLQ